MRPYNSLPRGHDVNDYPSLAVHQAKNENKIRYHQKPNSDTRHSPARRAHSEDVYNERKNEATQTNIVKEIIEKSMESSATDAEPVQERPAVRTNPLMRLNTEDRQDPLKSSGHNKTPPRRRIQNSKTEANCSEKSTKKREVDDTSKDFDMAIKETADKKSDRGGVEKRVSFENTVLAKTAQFKAEPSQTSSACKSGSCKTQSLNEDGSNISRKLQSVDVSRSSAEENEHDDDDVDTDVTSAEVHFPQEEPTPVELCDIEQISGTVFRKVTVRRRRQEMRKIPAVDTGKLGCYLLELTF